MVNKDNKRLFRGQVSVVNFYTMFPNIYHISLMLEAPFPSYNIS